MLTCKKGNDAFVDAQIEEEKEILKLQQQFHGQYRLISAVADQDVDVDMDGSKSNNLMREIPALKIDNHGHFVELRIQHPAIIANTSYLLSQFWPEQYLSGQNAQWDGGSDLEYKADAAVSYANQGTARKFRFSGDLNQIIVEPNDNENSYRWVAPESVAIDVTGKLHFVNKRHLYTSDGVKMVTIRTIYERF